MGRLVPEDIDVHHNVDINISIGDSAKKIGDAVESVIITALVASIVRSWFRRK